MVVFFFFSSRRRHTRYIGDWSSDVCSSDLRHLLMENGLRLGQILGEVRNAGEKDGGRGQAPEQTAGEAQRGEVNLLEADMQGGQLLFQAFVVAAPRDIVLHGHRFQARSEEHTSEL